MSTKLYKAVHQKMLAFQRRRRLIARAHGLGPDELRRSISYTEEAVLFTLIHQPGINTRDLANELGVERSWMSRIVNSLEKRGLISVKPSPSDRRSKELTITKSGDKLLFDSEELITEIINQTLAPLTQSEQKKFLNFLATYADGVGAPRYKNERVNPVHWELWRLSRGIGIMVGSLAGSALSNTQIQVLFVLKENGSDLILASDLEAMLPYDASTVSRVLSDFEERGWVERSPLKDDRRSLNVSLTKEGKAAYQEALDGGSKLVKKGVQSLDANELEEIVEILTKLLSAVAEVPLRNASRLVHEIEKMTVDQFASTAADFDHGVSPNELKSAFPSGGFALKAGKEIQGLAAVEKTDRTQRLYLCGNNLSDKEMLSFVKSCLRGQE